jgi:hypothetical protein
MWSRSNHGVKAPALFCGNRNQRRSVVDIYLGFAQRVSREWKLSDIELARVPSPALQDPKAIPTLADASFVGCVIDPCQSDAAFFSPWTPVSTSALLIDYCSQEEGIDLELFGVG